MDAPGPQGVVVTVTPAPAIDWTIGLEHFALGAIHVAASSRREASGKGVNVALALRRAGHAARAVVPAGGDGGAFLVEALTGLGLPHVLVPVRRPLRTNITLLTPGASTKVNEPGTDLADDEARALRDAVVAASADARLVLLCGSLPPGLDPGYHGALLRAVRAAHAGTPVWVDTSGAPLRAAVAAGPDLIKPNTDELAEFVGRPVRTLGEAARAAQEARAAGVGTVLASLGADGALLLDEEGPLHGAVDGLAPVNTVGAGDALLAGFAAGGGARPDRLRRALTWASSAVLSPTTGFDVRADLAARVRIGSLDPDRPLQAPSR